MWGEDGEEADISFVPLPVLYYFKEREYLKARKIFNVSL